MRLLAALLPAALLAVGLGLLVRAAGAENGELVFRTNSLYHRIYVYRSGSVVHLRFGRRSGIYQSSVDMSNLHRHVHEYTRLAMCGLLYNPDPRRILVLGLGGGVIPRTLRRHYPDALIDVAEIDPDVPPVAKRFFGFREDARLTVHINDGRMFIKRRLRRDGAPKYDLIVLDAFTSEYIPFHLMTREFLQEVRRVLADDGVVVANIFHTNRLADAELRTFIDVFGHCQVYPGRQSTNAMLVSTGPHVEPLAPPGAAQRAEYLMADHEFSFDLRQVARQLRPGLRPHPDTPVLTDDRAPVNLLRELPARTDWSQARDAVELRDGRRFTGWIMQLTEQQVVFETRADEGSTIHTWPLSQVAAVTVDGERREMSAPAR